MSSKTELSGSSGRWQARLVGFSTIAMVALFTAAVFFAPGHLVIRRLAPRATGIERMSLALAAGVFAVSFSSYVLAALTRRSMTGGGQVAVAAGVALVCLATSSMSPGSDAQPGRRLGVTWRVALPWVVGLSLLYAVFACRYRRDNFDLDGANLAAAQATGALDRAIGNEALMKSWGSSEGFDAMAAAFPAAFELLGFRLGYATTLFLVATLAIGCTRRLRTGWYGTLAFVALITFSPATFRIQETNDDLICLAATSATLLALLLDPPALALAGLFFGFAFSVEHAMLPGVVALLFVAFRQRRRARAIAAGLAGVVPAAAWCAIHHRAAFGSAFATERTLRFPEVIGHHLFGVDFAAHALLSWPFVDHLVRNPFRLLPSWVAAATAMPVHLGTAATAVVGIGAIRMLSRERVALATCCLLGGLPLVLVAVLGDDGATRNPTHFLAVAAPLSMPFVVGWKWITENRRRWAPWTCVALAAMTLNHIGAAVLNHRFPVDRRAYTAWPWLPTESAADERFTRALDLPDLGWLPDFTMNDVHQHVLAAPFLFHDLREELVDPRYASFPTPLPVRMSRAFGRPPLADGGSAPFAADATGGAQPTSSMRFDFSFASPLAESQDWIRPSANEPSSVARIVADPAPESREFALHGVGAPAFDGLVDIAVLLHRRWDKTILVMVVFPSVRSALDQSNLGRLPADRLSVACPTGAIPIVIQIRSMQPLVVQAWSAMMREGGRVEIEPQQL